VLSEHAGLAADEQTDRAHRVAGRIAARRTAGRAGAFIDLIDRSGKIQLYARVDELGDEGFERLLSLDLGDLIGADGVAIRTRSGELSLRVTSFTLLAKSLRPPPDHYHGLSDVETRFRRRELDLIANEETRTLFRTAHGSSAPCAERSTRTGSSRSRRRSCSRSTAVLRRVRS